MFTPILPPDLILHSATAMGMAMEEGMADITMAAVAAIHSASAGLA
jgi:hypothetical protein